MQHSPEEVGRQIGELIIAAKEQGANETQATAQAEIKEIQSKSVKPVVDIDVKSIAKAIEGISFDTKALEDVFKGLVKAVSGIETPNLKGIEKSISEASSKQSIEALTKAVQASLKQQTEAIANTDAIESLTETVMTFAKAVSDCTTAHAKAHLELINRIEQMQMLQHEMIEAQYARADLILDDNQEPIGVQKTRPTAN